MQTILITGTSSGIGRATVKHFAANGWQVAATMRSPEKETELKTIPNVKVYALDVMNTASIAQAVQNVLADFGSLDAIVNNAGYGAVGIFEAATPAQIQKQFDTNVFGVMNVIREVLPHFRAQKKGHIINVTSMGGRIAFPIYSVYHATKWAVEGFAESLQFELKPYGIRVKNVEPGAIKTDFYDRSMDLFKKEGLTAYDAYVQVAYKNSQAQGASAPGPEVVAQTIFKAANDKSYRIRYVTGGAQTHMLMFMRKILPLGWFMNLVRGVVEKGFKQA
jgi:NAD(P)-dependent dehydrogenase (short-subunit alcohol dehydrogenase family)